MVPYCTLIMFSIADSEVDYSSHRETRELRSLNDSVFLMPPACPWDKSDALGHHVEYQFEAVDGKSNRIGNWVTATTKQFESFCLKSNRRNISFSQMAVFPRSFLISRVAGGLVAFWYPSQARRIASYSSAIISIPGFGWNSQILVCCVERWKE